MRATRSRAGKKAVFFGAYVLMTRTTRAHTRKIITVIDNSC